MDEAEAGDGVLGRSPVCARLAGLDALEEVRLPGGEQRHLLAQGQDLRVVEGGPVLGDEAGGQVLREAAVGGGGMGQAAGERPPWM